MLSPINLSSPTKQMLCELRLINQKLSTQFISEEELDSIQTHFNATYEDALERLNAIHKVLSYAYKNPEKVQSEIRSTQEAEEKTLADLNSARHALSELCNKLKYDEENSQYTLKYFEVIDACISTSQQILAYHLPTQKQKTHTVYALDFDHCLMNEEAIKDLAEASTYLPELEGSQETEEYFDLRLSTIRESNHLLLQNINAPFNPLTDRKSVISFSNRQCRGIESFNLYEKKLLSESVFVGSSFPVFKALFKGQAPSDVHFIPLLLPDSFHQLAPGSTYRSIMEEDFGELNYECCLDIFKIALSYQTAHYFASEAPQDNHIIKICDDNADILKHNASFFKRHSERLPQNVRVEYYQYTGKNSQTLLYSLNGTGLIDCEYARTLSNWAKTIAPED